MRIFEVRGNFGELSQRSLEVFDDLGGDDVGIGKISAVFEASSRAEAGEGGSSFNRAA